MTMPRDLDGVAFVSVLERFAWQPVISASQFKHANHKDHYIVVYPGSAIHYYADYPWGSYGHSEYLNTPLELETHLAQFHELALPARNEPRNLKRKTQAA